MRSGIEQQYDYSVAIPAYGRPEEVRETVRAALAQRFPLDMRWEVFVNDDCAPTPLAKALAEFKGRIRIERNGRNLGFTGNWNKTLALARGKWVHMLHSDDLVAPEFAPVMWELIRQAPINTAFIHSRLRNFVICRPLIGRLYSRVRGRRQPEDDLGAPFYVYRPGAEAVRHAMQTGVRITTIILRKGVACAIQGFQEEYGNFSDEEYVVRLAQVGAVIFTPRRLVTYRYHTNQLSRRDWLRPEFIDEYGEMYDASLSVLGAELTEQDRAAINRRVAAVGAGVALAQALHGDVAVARTTLWKARNRDGGIKQTPEYRKAELLVNNKLARMMYRTFFIG